MILPFLSFLQNDKGFNQLNTEFNSERGKHCQSGDCVPVSRESEEISVTTENNNPRTTQPPRQRPDKNASYKISLCKFLAMFGIRYSDCNP